MQRNVLIAGTTATKNIVNELLNVVKEDKLLGIKTTYNYIVYVSLDGKTFHQTDWVKVHTDYVQFKKGKASTKRLDADAIRHLWFNEVIIIKEVTVQDTRSNKVFKFLRWHESIKPIPVEVDYSKVETFEKVASSEILVNNLLYVDDESWTIVRPIIGFPNKPLSIGDMTNIHSMLRKTNRFDVIPPKGATGINIVISKEKTGRVKVKTIRTTY